MNAEGLRHIIMRVALSSVFIIFGVWEIINPQYWQGFVPAFVQSFISSLHPIVMLHGAVLLIAGLMILAGFYTRIGSAIAFLVLLEISVSLLFESGFSDLFVRDLALLLLSAAVFFDKARYLSLNKK